MKRIKFVDFVFIYMLILTSCSKSTDYGSMITKIEGVQIYDISYTTVRCKANVVNCNSIDSSGIFIISPESFVLNWKSYFKNLNPDLKTIETNIINLNPNSEYIIKAYISTPFGMLFSEEQKFKTETLPDNPRPIEYNNEIIYVFPDEDNHKGIPWGNTIYNWSDSRNLSMNAKSESDGAFNTEIIVKEQEEGNYAAKVCYDLEAYGYDDWYLPSKNELEAIFKNEKIAVGLNSCEAEFCGSIEYWSSTYSEDGIWTHNDYSGMNKCYFSSNSLRVRCVRK